MDPYQKTYGLALILAAAGLVTFFWHQPRSVEGSERRADCSIVSYHSELYESGSRIREPERTASASYQVECQAPEGILATEIFPARPHEALILAEHGLSGFRDGRLMARCEINDLIQPHWFHLADSTPAGVGIASCELALSEF